MRVTTGRQPGRAPRAPPRWASRARRADSPGRGGAPTRSVRMRKSLALSGVVSEKPLTHVSVQSTWSVYNNSPNLWCQTGAWLALWLAQGGVRLLTWQRCPGEGAPWAGRVWANAAGRPGTMDDVCSLQSEMQGGAQGCKWAGKRISCWLCSLPGMLFLMRVRHSHVFSL